MKKLDKYDRQEQKARETIAAMRAVIKQIDGERTEQENLQIVRKIRAFKISRDELHAFLDEGVLPAALAAAAGDTAAETETIYSRPERLPRGDESETNEAYDHEREEPDNED